MRAAIMRPIDALVLATRGDGDNSREAVIERAAGYARSFGIGRAKLARTLDGTVADALAEAPRDLSAGVD